MTLVKITDSRDKILTRRREDIFLRMRVNSGRSILSLTNSIQILEYSFNILFVLEKETAFYCFTQFVHFFQTYFFLLLV